MTVIRAISLVALSASAPAVWGGAETHAAKVRPNVLFITADDMNYDSTGDYGMSFPFAKSNDYETSSRGALIVRWPSCASGGRGDQPRIGGAPSPAPSVPVRGRSERACSTVRSD